MPAVVPVEGADDLVLLCHRFPPVPVFQPDEAGGGVSSAWPMVEEGDACGEHDARRT